MKQIDTMEVIKLLSSLNEIEEMDMYMIVCVKHIFGLLL